MFKKGISSEAQGPFKALDPMSLKQ